MREHVEEPRYVTTDDDTVYSLLSKRAARTPDDIIAEWQDDNTHQWRSATATEMLSRVREVAKGLLGLGVKAGTMVLIYSPTCYEWGVADFACAAIGAVVVPVYETDSARQTAGIVEEVDPAIAFAGDFQRAQTLEQIRVNHPGMKYVFNFKADGLDAVVDFGHGVSDETLDAAIARIKADDLLTVVYTSGSTGKPKGAMLSNRNYTHIVLNGYEILRGMLYDDNRLLLFLPLAHCFARYIQYVCIGGCGVVGYIPDAKRLLADIRSFKPTYLLGVPRVFEKVYNAASQKAGAGIQGHIFAQSVKHFVKWSKDEQAGRGGDHGEHRDDADLAVDQHHGDDRKDIEDHGDGNDHRGTPPVTHQLLLLAGGVPLLPPEVAEQLAHVPDARHREIVGGLLAFPFGEQVAVFVVQVLEHLLLELDHLFPGGRVLKEGVDESAKFILHGPFPPHQ